MKYDWSESNMKNMVSKSYDWYRSVEGYAYAEKLVEFQRSDGGWVKPIDPSSSSATAQWAHSTIDNNATHTQIRILARAYKATGVEKYKESCLKGIDCLVNGQYPNGGFPQVFNWKGTYHQYITYNDQAMIRAMETLTDAYNKKGDFSFIDDEYAAKAKKCVEKGIECIINTQIVNSKGEKQGWCQQYDDVTLEPRPARAFEPAANSTQETVYIIKYLKTLKNPSAEITDAINSAIKWLDKVKIKGHEFVSVNGDKVFRENPKASLLWARFYEFETDLPIFGDRDGKVYYDVSQISKERRTGYSWYGNWGKEYIKS